MIMKSAPSTMNSLYSSQLSNGFGKSFPLSFILWEPTIIFVRTFMGFDRLIVAFRLQNLVYLVGLRKQLQQLLGKPLDYHQHQHRRGTFLSKAFLRDPWTAQRKVLQKLTNRFWFVDPWLDFDWNWCHLD